MYDYLDWIIPWYLDDYVTLTDQQERLFDRATLRFLRWHRNQELPRYAAFISSVKDAQAEPMSRQQVVAFFTEATDLWQNLIAESMPELLALAKELSTEQTLEIDRALTENRQELEEKYGSKDDSKQRKIWQEKLTDRIDDWLGSVTDEQLDLIKNWSRTRINTTDQWLSYRYDWQKKFMALLGERYSDTFSRKMERFLLNPEESYSASYQLAVLKNREHFAQLISDLSATLKSRQRAHLQQELAGIISDLTELMRNAS